MSKSDLQNIPTGISVHNYQIAVKGIKKKVIYHFSDVHLTEYDEASDENEKRIAIEGTENWEKTRIYFAERHNEPYSKEQLKSTHTLFSDMLTVADSGDALVMTGDVCDRVGKADLRFVEAELSRLSVPFVSVLGNHEKAEEMPENHILSRMKDPVQIMELGDIVILGIDDSLRFITKEQNEQIEKILSCDKPVIIAMHIPVMTEGNQAQLEECGEYFKLNHREAAKEVFDFVDLIKQYSDKIIAVLAGHLHFANNSEITPGVTQYVSSQGALGNINRYEIGI